MVVSIRAVEADDLEAFFEQQLDPEAVRRAQFPSRLDRETFFAHWTNRVLGDPTVVARTVIVDGRVAGNVVCWEKQGRRHIGYWYGRDFWGRGVATLGLNLFVGLVTTRPLYADTVEGNAGSIRVLEKCGFRRLPTREAPDEVLFVLAG